MAKKINILGATGSIGRSALDVVSRHPGEWQVGVLAAGSRAEELAAACEACGAEAAVLADESKLPELQAALKARGLSTRAAAGEAACCEAASDPEADAVLLAASGAAGLSQAFAAAKAGKCMLLANKESVVCGGALLQQAIREGGAELLPVDSEHSAIFQSLAAATPAQREKAVIWLTCSGGPFLRRMDLTGVTVEEASTHPRWNMGRKITVDSATLMNKALEVIEARWLFDIPPERIRVVIHPQSILHSGVAFEDGAVMAELGVPDMRTPIAVAMAWPERTESGAAALDFTKLKEPLTFEAPDLERFPQLKLAWEALEAGGSAAIVLNAANEAAVAAFLDRKISFLGIGRACREALSGLVLPAPKSLSDIYAADREARSFVVSLIRSGRIS